MAPNHVAEVTLLASQLGYPNEISEVARRFSKIGSSSEFGLFVALSENDEVMGFLQVNEEPDTLLVGRRADISALVVHEKFRNERVGAALVKCAEEWVLAKGLNLLRVKSNIRREGAHRFYQREGYELSKTAHMFVKNLS